MHKIKVKGQLLQELEWKQTDGQTDTTDCSTLPAYAAGNDWLLVVQYMCVVVLEAAIV